MEYQIHVRGLVQGVGFRPYVCRLAREMGLAGSVDNDTAGVSIVLQAAPEQESSFMQRLLAELPPVARVDAVEVRVCRETRRLERPFAITPSRDTSEGVTHVSPDIAVCDKCLDDMRTQPHRIDYPFINCTACGPRFSIIRELPYDRSATTMSPFALCPDCSREYRDENDRRFHAEPVACNRCGPSYCMRCPSGLCVDTYAEVRRHLASILLRGGVVALKGVGGYNLIADAFSPAAVARLRALKERPRKPFAVMFRDVVAARRFVALSRQETALLTSWRRPILLARQRGALSPGINEGYCTLGVLLPFQPIHYHIFADTGLEALVFTSGNRKGFPLCADDAEAWRQLGDGVDGFVSYNRAIYNRVDDSVVQYVAGAPRLLRRARGYAPEPLCVGDNVEGVFAAGAERTNHFAIGRGRDVILSPYIGTLRDAAVAALYDDTVGRYTHLFRFEPRVVVCDRHPDYVSTRFAEAYASRRNLPLIRVQHHHAHAAAVMAEYRLFEPVLAVCLDGTGAGDDGCVWGGEFLWTDRAEYRRLSHFPYLPMPGGDAAARQPWRMAVALLHALRKGARFYPPGFCRRVGESKVSGVERMCFSQELSPSTSAAGRLFDAVASLLGICDENSYESEAAVLLEQTACRATNRTLRYPLNRQTPLDLSPLFSALLDDVAGGRPAADVAYAFHATLADVVFAETLRLFDRSLFCGVVLSGGVFQNKILSELLCKRFAVQGIPFFLPEKMPVHDGAIAVGQAVVASACRGVD